MNPFWLLGIAILTVLCSTLFVRRWVVEWYLIEATGAKQRFWYRVTVVVGTLFPLAVPFFLTYANLSPEPFFYTCVILIFVPLQFYALFGIVFYERRKRLESIKRVKAFRALMRSKALAQKKEISLTTELAALLRRNRDS